MFLIRASLEILILFVLHENVALIIFIFVPTNDTRVRKNKKKYYLYGLNDFLSAIDKIAINV